MTVNYEIPKPGQLWERKGGGIVMIVSCRKTNVIDGHLRYAVTWLGTNTLDVESTTIELVSVSMQRWHFWLQKVK